MIRSTRLLPAITLLTAAAIVGAERRYPLRTPTQAEPHRTLRNVALGIAALAVVQFAETPLVAPLASIVERRRLGLAQRLPLPAWARDAAAILVLDYSIYLWHVLTHKLPFLWRFHQVHHVDLDLDASTALRFHAVDMAISAPYRALQIITAGASPRALKLWQSFFFLSVLFHHSNIRLPSASNGSSPASSPPPACTASTTPPPQTRPTATGPPASPSGITSTAPSA